MIIKIVDADIIKFRHLQARIILREIWNDLKNEIYSEKRFKYIQSYILLFLFDNNTITELFNILNLPNNILINLEKNVEMIDNYLNDINIPYERYRLHTYFTKQKFITFYSNKELENYIHKLELTINKCNYGEFKDDFFRHKLIDLVPNLRETLIIESVSNIICIIKKIYPE